MEIKMVQQWLRSNRIVEPVLDYSSCKKTSEFTRKKSSHIAPCDLQSERPL